MKAVFRVSAALILVLWIAGCASQEEAPVAETPEETPPAATARPAPVETDVLAAAEIAAFRAADGTIFAGDTIVELPTGGPPAGRLIPTSARNDVTLYVTRDGSVPAPTNNWGGAIDPADPPVISRPLEGVASYRVVAGLDGRFSEPFTLTVIWKHEESPDLRAPVFLADGRAVSGSVSIPVSDGTDPSARLQITCGYSSAMLYVTRDGSEPSVDNNWQSQRCEGTYIWSPEPTFADYRVIAIWRGVQSPVAALSVEWID